MPAVLPPALATMPSKLRPFSAELIHASTVKVGDDTAVRGSVVGTARKPPHPSLSVALVSPSAVAPAAALLMLWPEYMALATTPSEPLFVSTSAMGGCTVSCSGK